MLASNWAREILAEVSCKPSPWHPKALILFGFRNKFPPALDLVRIPG